MPNPATTSHHPHTSGGKPTGMKTALPARDSKDLTTSRWILWNPGLERDLHVNLLVGGNLLAHHWDTSWVEPQMLRESIHQFIVLVVQGNLTEPSQYRRQSSGQLSEIVF